MRRACLFFGVIGLFTLQILAGALFEGAQNTFPAQQQWIYLSEPLFNPKATQRLTNQAVRLDSLVTTTEKAGYFTRAPFFGSHPGVGVLDRRAGFRVRFAFELLAELHNSTNRAGFSVIVLADDLRGIELGFWMDEIWAQTDIPLFIHGEGVKQAVGGARREMTLEIQGESYTLGSGGGTLLQGPLRDYRAFGQFPYTTNNFIFLGDDTSSAAATVDIAFVAVEPIIAGPLRLEVISAGTNFAYRVIAPSTGNYAVSSSVNLVDWQTNAVLVNFAGTTNLTAETQETARFFRLGGTER